MDFKVGKIKVILKRGYSNANEIITPDHFPELDVESVTDLMPVTNPDLVDWDGFRQILLLEFKTKSKEHVLYAMPILESRKEVLVTEPDYNYFIKDVGLQ